MTLRQMEMWREKEWALRLGILIAIIFAVQFACVSTIVYG